MANSSPVDPENPASHGESTERRGFLGLLAILAGGIAGLVPVAAGTLFFLDPILRKRKEAAAGLVRAGNKSDLPTDGTPVRVTLQSDVVDAWSVYRNRVIGSVYIRLMPTGDVLAFNDTCTHLGCKVDYQAPDKQFFCPCHQSAFDLDGQRKNMTPPRALDSLEVEVKGDEVWIKYQNFRTATDKKEAV